MREMTPEEAGRAKAWETFKDAPMPMVTVLKTMDITPLFPLKEQGHKLNMLFCYCILRAAEQMPPFYTVIKEGKFCAYDKLCCNIVVKAKTGELCYVNVPNAPTLAEFEQAYLTETKKAFECGEDSFLEDAAIVGTSCIPNFVFDGLVNAYNLHWSNPFLAWGAYKTEGEKRTVSLSFQFHHGQMDGEHAGHFLSLLQDEINGLGLL